MGRLTRSGNARTLHPLFNLIDILTNDTTVRKLLPNATCASPHQRLGTASHEIHGNTHHEHSHTTYFTSRTRSVEL